MVTTATVAMWRTRQGGKVHVLTGQGTRTSTVGPQTLPNTSEALTAMSPSTEAAETMSEGERATDAIVKSKKA
eukprot:CAMPEP_0204108180 /NCGR_PEP_ID=MMETSP0361-20130328/566_1 /ASSEMBLY_ACC=CAM_ASM_000343 /TAXON_ID=268821 /ORGANISM="Scrippsiella Hangoei, Strain SHTV-5" /LENGTH=72 /DNA_ID=CAMNT_0051057769 /DNA_START=348 /DNA_END=562 /DNA_ORIENTATION=+